MAALIGEQLGLTLNMEATDTFRHSVSIKMLC